MTALSHLSLVEDGIYELGREPASTAERVRLLQEQARVLAREQVEELQAALRRVGEMADAVAKGGDTFPVGIRDMAQRIAEDLPERAKRMEPLVERFWEKSWPLKLDPGGINR